MGDWVGWSLPGEGGDHLGGAPAPPRDGPLLGWGAWVSAGEDPVAPAARIWVQPRAPGEDSVGLGGCQRTPLQAFQEGTPHGSAEIFLPSILSPSHPEKSSQGGGRCKLKWLNIRS